MSRFRMPRRAPADTTTADHDAAVEQLIAALWAELTPTEHPTDNAGTEE